MKQSLLEKIQSLLENNGKYYMAYGIEYSPERTPEQRTQTLLLAISEAMPKKKEIHIDELNNGQMLRDAHFEKIGFNFYHEKMKEILKGREYE